MCWTGVCKNSFNLASEDYSIADICAWPWVRSWIHTTKQSLGARRRLTRWFETIEQRPAVRKAIEIYDGLRSGRLKS